MSHAQRILEQLEAAEDEVEDEDLAERLRKRRKELEEAEDDA